MMMMLFIFCAVLFGVCLSEDSNTKMPNIGYLGQGYNLIKGNPNPFKTDLLVDPGFTSPVVDLAYTTSSHTADGKWLIPDNVNLLQSAVCSLSATTTTWSGQQSYSDSLKLSASVSADVVIPDTPVTVGFSASTSYQEVSQSIYGSENRFVRVSMACNSYQVNLIADTYSPTDAFIDAVEALPDTVDLSTRSDPYYVLLDNYGTHFTQQVFFGGKFYKMFEYTKESWKTLNSQNIDASEELKVGVEGVGGISLGSSQSTSSSKEKESVTSAESTETWIAGEPIGEDGDVTAWHAAVIDNPFPYKYELKGIETLLTTTFIQRDSLSADILAIKKTNLENALKRYCGYIQGCAAPLGPLPSIQYISQTEASAAGTANAVSCPAGQKLLSCGIDIDQDGSNTYETYWSTWPSSDTSCTSYNRFAGKVYAVCAEEELVGDVSIQSAAIPALGENGGDGTVTVPCPDGYKVTGCGYQSHLDQGTENFEKWKQFYPNTDSSCLCYDAKGGSTCWSICSNNVLESTVKTEGFATGIGTATVTCDNAEDIVFGCGLALQITPNDNYEILPSIKTSGQTQCVGFSAWTYQISSVCGRFVAPTWAPTADPTTSPTINPSVTPTAAPSMSPSTPSISPTMVPSISPIIKEVDTTINPTMEPTMSPTVTLVEKNESNSSYLQISILCFWLTVITAISF